MNFYPDLYIIAAALLGAAIGYLVCAGCMARRIHEADRDAWREARDHFSRLYSHDGD